MSKFRHECPEWDFAEIDEKDFEFACCTCFDTPEAKAAAEEMQRKLDDYNERKTGERES